MAPRPILCPAVKMKPYSVLCRPSVSLLKPKNKDWVEQNIFIARRSRCRWLRAEWDLWKERAEPEKTQSTALWLTQGWWKGLNVLFRHVRDREVKTIPWKKRINMCKMASCTGAAQYGAAALIISNILCLSCTFHTFMRLKVLYSKEKDMPQVPPVKKH